MTPPPPPPPPVSSGDPPWVLAPTALVLLLTVGRGCLSGGLAPPQNALTTIRL